LPEFLRILAVIYTVLTLLGTLLTFEF